MPTLKLTNSVAAEVLRLHNTGTPHNEIGLKLGLKKMQVAAIVAYQDISTTRSSRPFEEMTSSQEGGDAPRVDIDYQPEPPLAVELPKHDEEMIEEPEGVGIYVGDDVDYHDSRYWAPWESREVQNPHLMIIGESGSGKTYAVQCLVAELAQHDLPSVIFDYGQSFEIEFLEKEFVKHFNPSDYLIGEEGLALNPLQIFPKDLQGPNAVASRVSDVFDAVYRLGDIQRKVLIDAILQSFENVGVQAADRSTWKMDPPSLSVLQQVLENMASDKDYPNYKNAAGVSARLTTFFMLNSFRSDSLLWSWENFVKESKERVHILQFRGLEGKTQRVVVELLLWHLFFYLKSEGQHPLRVYCILDEAHHLSFRDGGPIDSLLREARKFGLGIIFASQQPEDFSPAAFSNSASKLVFQTTDPTLRVSKFLAQKCRNHEDPKEIHDLISMLRQGEAFFITENKGHVIRIADFKKRSTLWS